MNRIKCLLYARKSTEDEDRQIMSIEAQLTELRQFARKENLRIIAEYTESKSAKEPGRPVFGEMMARRNQRALVKATPAWTFFIRESNSLASLR